MAVTIRGICFVSGAAVDGATARSTTAESATKTSLMSGLSRNVAAKHASFLYCRVDTVHRCCLLCGPPRSRLRYALQFVRPSVLYDPASHYFWKDTEIGP